MSDLDILRQLLSGNHLEKRELERAEQLLKSLLVNVEGRI